MNTSSTSQKISRKIERFQKGKPFTVKAFSGLGSREAIRKTLSRLVERGELVRPARGVYARPKPNKFFGVSMPDPIAVVKVIAEKNGEKVEVHGAETARMFGLTTQAPMKYTFYTSGSTRKRTINNTQVHFEHVPEVCLKHAGTPVGKAISALHYMGPKHVGSSEFAKVVNQLSTEDQTTLRETLPELPKWFSKVAMNA